MTRRVLITRLGGFLSRRLASDLERDPSISYVLGIDSSDPEFGLDRTEFLKVDIRRPVLLKILEAADIDTVVHLGLYSTPSEAGGRPAMHDLNVIGTMQLLAACQKAPSVKRVIVRSSTSIYGAEPTHPAVFSEEMAGANPSGPFGRDISEVEDYVADLARRRPDIKVTAFRFANILGPTCDTPIADYLTMPVVPTALGFDPRLQFLHEDDAARILLRAVREPIPGVFNAAGEGVLYLSQVIRMGGRVQLPVPGLLLDLTAPAARLLGRRIQVPPHVLSLVRWGRVTDNRRLREEFGYKPEFTTRDAVREFYDEHRLRRVAPRGDPERWERELRDFVTRKGQERFVERVPVGGQRGSSAASDSEQKRDPPSRKD